MSDASSVLSDDLSEQEIFDHSLSMWRDKRSSVREADDFNFKMEDEFEPLELDLHTECGIGHYDCVRSAVMSENVELDKKNKGGWTPLMYACYTGHEGIVNLLIEAGVNLNLTTHKLISPLMLASSCGNEGIVKILVEHGALIDRVDYRGWTALFHATFSGQQVIVKYLLECGADAEICEVSQDMTALMEAAQAGHEGIVNCFLLKGVDTRRKSNKGNSALTLAMLRGHSRVVTAIQEFNRKNDSLQSKPLDSPKSILKHTNTLFEGPEAVKKLMKKLAFKDELSSREHPLPPFKPHLHTSTTDVNSTTSMVAPTLFTHTNSQSDPTTPTSNPTTTPTTTPTVPTPNPTTTLQQLLYQQGLSKYLPTFLQQDVDISIFFTLTDHDLKEIGINLLGPRKKMLMAINRWNNNNKTNINNNSNNSNNNINNRNNNNSYNHNNINTINENFKNLSESEIRKVILSLDMRNEELAGELRKETQVRRAVETSLINERNHHHNLVVNAGNLVNRYKENSDALIKNLRESIISLVSPPNADHLRDQSVSISSIIEPELANQTLDLIRISQSQEAIFKMGRSCDALEAFMKVFFEDLPSFLSFLP